MYQKLFNRLKNHLIGSKYNCFEQRVKFRCSCCSCCTGYDWLVLSKYNYVFLIWTKSVASVNVAESAHVNLLMLFRKTGYMRCPLSANIVINQKSLLFKMFHICTLCKSKLLVLTCKLDLEVVNCNRYVCMF